MKHLGTLRLESERLILRKIALCDSKDMFNNWANNPRVTKHMTWPTHQNEEVTIMVINSWIEQYVKDDFYQWAIEIKDTNQVIGTISVVRILDYIKEFEIGYCIGENWWNKGITSEALSLVIEFLFNQVGANRICACHDVDNPSSGKVMIKNNMKYEGTFRKKEITSTGKICDIAYYSILKEEYKL